MEHIGKCSKMEHFDTIVYRLRSGTFLMSLQSSLHSKESSFQSPFRQRTPSNRNKTLYCLHDPVDTMFRATKHNVSCNKMFRVTPWFVQKKKKKKKHEHSPACMTQ